MSSAAATAIAIAAGESVRERFGRARALAGARPVAFLSGASAEGVVAVGIVVAPVAVFGDGVAGVPSGT